MALQSRNASNVAAYYDKCLQPFIVRTPISPTEAPSDSPLEIGQFPLFLGVFEVAQKYPPSIEIQRRSPWH